MAGATGKRGAARKTSAKAEGPELQQDLREFASARPQGWNHEDWLNFLEYLKGRGHDTGDADEIGRRLERERIAVALKGVEGLGPRRLEALEQRFGSLWHIRQASVEAIAALPSINRTLAQQIRERLEG
jgi:hypothetical protein